MNNVNDIDNATNKQIFNDITLKTASDIMNILQRNINLLTNDQDKIILVKQMATGLNVTVLHLKNDVLREKEISKEQITTTLKMLTEQAIVLFKADLIRQRGEE